jgi:hypothetical protein
VAAAGLALRTALPESLHVTGDPERLRQVIDNLLANAIKYSPDGGDIEVTLHHDGYAAELVVADTGIGIPPAERDQLFERFYRSSRTRERSIPGAGLSLAISRAIVRRHEGSIALAPGTSPGTRIVVRLPLAPPSPGLPPLGRGYADREAYGKGEEMTQPDEDKGGQRVRAFGVADPEDRAERASEERAVPSDDLLGDPLEGDAGPHVGPDLPDTAQHRGDRI